MKIVLYKDSIINIIKSHGGTGRPTFGRTSCVIHLGAISYGDT